ncbi:hypothetical protein RBB77_01690 [Tunturibacter psychrotolerans]|uniref:Uncharacterized protein n=1 Tax=Tunturiibacter psychrotolerans TaxID=3069686 RepID=A0AAU7ZRR5_9BACT
MDPITQGVAGNAIWNALAAVVRAVRPHKIKIISPRPQEMLGGREPLGGGFSYAIRGTLKKLPKGHEIWVLTRDDSTGYVWPQGFSPVQYDPVEGTWTGRVNGSGKAEVRIIAVVAPPTSQDYFRYFQELGRLRDYNFKPLPCVPAECLNLDSVQAKIPKS